MRRTEGRPKKAGADNASSSFPGSAGPWRSAAIVFLLIACCPAIPLYGQTYPAVYVVVFTHIEDNTPAADLSTPLARTQYLNLRSRMIEMAGLAAQYHVQWSFQPDWKVLLAARQFEDAATMQNTNGKNLLRYLKEDLHVAVDPHSHEKQGYNYSDVAYLLQTLGTGGSTVIGGHVWDPSLPQFQQWDRFRVSVPGTKYPEFSWRGDILMGSGTPNHVNDPYVTGVWRPKDRYDYFVDDPAGNITCIGQYKGDVAGVIELVDAYRAGKFSPADILTASIHVEPLSITTPGGLQTIEETILQPLATMRDRGEVECTDFTALVQTWKTKFGGRAFLYDAKSVAPPRRRAVRR